MAWRGVGIGRGHQESNRERNLQIYEWYTTGHHSVRWMSDHFGIGVNRIYQIISMERLRRSG